MMMAGGKITVYEWPAIFWCVGFYPFQQMPTKKDKILKILTKQNL